MTQSCLPPMHLGRLQDQYLLTGDRSHCLGAGHRPLWFVIWFSTWACALVCEIEGLDPNSLFLVMVFLFVIHL